MCGSPLLNWLQSEFDFALSCTDAFKKVRGLNLFMYCKGEKLNEELMGCTDGEAHIRAL